MFDMPNLLTRGLYEHETPYISRFDFSDPPLYEGQIFRKRADAPQWEVHIPYPSFTLSEFFLTVNADFGPSLLFAGLEKRIRRFQSIANPSEIMLFYRGRNPENAVKEVERAVWDGQLKRSTPGRFLRGGFCLAGLINEQIVGFSEDVYELHPQPVRG